MSTEFALTGSSAGFDKAEELGALFDRIAGSSAASLPARH
jgi:hypothetical protein